jgi:pimeloyl-ACP methyl ester carboxylesterase
VTEHKPRFTEPAPNLSTHNFLARIAQGPSPSSLLLKYPMNTIQRNNVHSLGDSGPVLLYAHGFGCNQAMWNRITPAFEGTHRQVLFDYVGSGKSNLASFNPER